LVVGLFVPKFIGLELIISMQIIYYSQMLIVEYEKWPIGMYNILKGLRSSSGYNEILKLT